MARQVAEATGLLIPNPWHKAHVGHNTSSNRHYPLTTLYHHHHPHHHHAHKAPEAHGALYQRSAGAMS